MATTTGAVGAAGDEESHAVLTAMEQEHSLIDPILAECAGGFAALTDQFDVTELAALRIALDRAWELLDQHLSHEEQDAMPLVQRYLDQKDWERLQRQYFRPAYGFGDLLSIVAWAIKGLPLEVRRTALAAGGPPMQVLWRLTHRRFARRDQEVFGAAAAALGQGTNLVAVVGATGTIGRIVLDELVAQQAAVRVLVRTVQPAGHFPPGVTQTLADLHDEEAVRSALRGVRAALYISPHEDDEEAHAQRFVRAAASTGTRIIFAGSHIAVRNPMGWLQLKMTERLLPAYLARLRVGQLISASRPSPVMFSPTNFYQNDEIFESDIRAGAFPMPMRRVNRVDVRDLAELCARAVLDPSHPAGEHNIAGPESLSGQECADVWTAALGRSVDYVGEDEDRWMPIYQQRLSGRKLDDFISTARLLGRRKVIVPRDVAATSALLGHAPRPYAAYVADKAAQPSDSEAVEVSRH